MPDNYWPSCCGATGWRYYLADGRSGWRCWCGAHRPDQLELVELVTVELPATGTD